MKHLSKPPVLSSLCAVLGLLCFFLRQWLLGSGLDGNGLLLVSHPVNFLVWVLTAAVAGVLIWLFFTWNKQVTCVFPHTPLSTTASLLLTVGYLLAVLRLFAQPVQLISLIAGVLGLLSALCTALISLGQFRHQRMHPLLYCPGILFFLCYLIAQYPQWSGEPQPQLFFFQMMSCVCLLFTVFCRAELAAGKISGRNYFVFSRASIFLCIGAIARSGDALVYICFATAILLDSCRVEMKAHKNPEPPKDTPQAKDE